MARIIGVHGVGHQYSGAQMLRANWLPALQDGLAQASQPATSTEDFDCAFYGHLFRPTGKAAIAPPLDASDLNDDWERALLQQLWSEATSIDAAVSVST